MSHDPSSANRPRCLPRRARAGRLGGHSGRTSMQSDIEIARSISLRPIVEIAERLGLDRGELQLYGDDVAKVALSVLDRLPEKPRGRLVLISAITPTVSGQPGSPT